MGRRHLGRGLPALAAATLIASGCGGGGAKLESRSTTTMGRELMNLDNAYKGGVIDQQQYDTTKRQSLKRYEK